MQKSPPFAGSDIRGNPAGIPEWKKKKGKKEMEHNKVASETKRVVQALHKSSIPFIVHF